MRVVIDAVPALSTQRTGIGLYTARLLDLLPRIDPETTYVAWYASARRLLRGDRPRFARSDVPNLEERWVPLPNRMFQSNATIPRVEWFVSFDVLFAPNFVPPNSRPARLVLTVHDLAFRRFPGTVTPRTARWLRGLDRALRRATRVIAVSESTKRDLAELYAVDPGRIDVVAHGIDHDVYRPASPDAVRAVRGRYGIDGPYFLFVGGFEPRKNIPGLLRAFGRVDADVSLVIAGAPVLWNAEGREALERELRALPGRVRARVVLPGYVSEQEKVALLGGSVALAFPSLYEGFGLPVVEAMACGAPVLTSNVSALPETAGDAALLVDPRDEQAIARGMERLLSDGDLRPRLRDAGLRRAKAFTWEETARRTAATLHRAGQA